MAGELAEPTMRAYNPTWRDQLAHALLGDSPTLGAQKFITGLLGSTGLGTAGASLSDMTPLGGVFGAQEAARQGDYQGAAIASLGVLPGVGAIEREAAELPMDAASRMIRAKSMGFHTGMPVYHGSPSEFTAFQAVPTTQAGMATPGVSVALDPQVANEFAAAKQGNGQANPQVYPLFHRASKPGVLTLDGTEKQGEIASTLAGAFDQGHDAVMLKNYTTPAGETGKNIIVVRDPSQLRSAFAAFDPSKIASPDLLAGIGAAAAGGGAFAAYDAPPDQASQ